MIGYTAVIGCLACGSELEPLTVRVMDAQMGRAEALCRPCNLVTVVVLTVTTKQAP
jgi:hypothetical protein